MLGHVLHFNASAGDGGVLLPRRRALELTARLLELGALAKVPAFQERVPLVNLAAAADDLDIYNLLISKVGALHVCQGPPCGSPVCLRSARAECTQELKQGAVPGKAKDALGRTALHYAAAKGATRVGADLLDSKGLKVRS